MNKKAQNPLITYVIVCWNNREIIRECIDSIDSQTYKNRKIIIVDNGSTDDSVSLVQTKYPHVEVVATGKNNGFAIANNIGIKRALTNKDCRYIALINTDARISKKWTQTLIDFTRNNKHIASLQTPTLDYYDHSIYDSFGITVDHFGRAVQIGYRSTKGPTRSQRVFGVNFAAAVITREFLEAQPFTDYLDEDMWMYLEDVDFAARATITGWENWLVTGAEAYHMGSASSSKNPGFSVFMSYRNNIYMIIKNFPATIVLRLLIGATFADMLSYYQLIRGKNRAAIKAIIKGRLISITHFGVFLKKRRKVISRRGIENNLLRELMDPKNFSTND